MTIFLEPMTFEEWMNISRITNSELGLEEHWNECPKRGIEYYKVIDERKFFLAVIKYSLRYKILTP